MHRAVGHADVCSTQVIAAGRFKEIVGHAAGLVESAGFAHGGRKQRGRTAYGPAVQTVAAVFCRASIARPGRETLQLASEQGVRGSDTNSQEASSTIRTENAQQQEIPLLFAGMWGIGKDVRGVVVLPAVAGAKAAAVVHAAARQCLAVGRSCWCEGRCAV